MLRAGIPLVRAGLALFRRNASIVSCSFRVRSVPPPPMAPRPGAPPRQERPSRRIRRKGTRRNNCCNLDRDSVYFRS